MERTSRIAGAGMNRNFFEDSPQNSARPQASSTFVLSKTDTDFKENNENSINSPKPESSPSGLSTTSSLGVIDVEKQSLFSDKDDSFSRKLKDTSCNSSFVEGQASLSIERFKNRLDAILKNSHIGNTKNRNSTSKKSNGILNRCSNNFEIPQNGNSTTKMSCVPDSVQSPSRLSILTDMSHMSSPVMDFKFKSGKAITQLFEEDQKENKNIFASLPVSPMNISENSENFEEKEKNFSQFIKVKSYTPDQIADILRNNQIEVKSLNISENMNESFESCQVSSPMNDFSPLKFDSKLPDFSKLFSRSDRFTLKKYSKVDEVSSTTDINGKSLKSNTNYRLSPNIKNSATSLFDDSLLSTDSFEESAANSIASINQIAETLRRESLMAEPRLAIEHLLSLGKFKSKLTASVSMLNPPISKQPENTFIVSSPINTETTQVNVTPALDINESVKTPSTLTCPARKFCIDCITGKVHGVRNISFNGANNPSHSIKPAETNEIISHSEKKKSKSNFFLKQTLSSLSICNKLDEENSEFQFFKLNQQNEFEKINVSLNSTSDMINGYRKEICERTNNSIILNGDSSYNNNRLNSTAKPVRRISSNHNVTNVIKDDMNTDFEDTINAGALCLGTQVEVIIAVENPTPDLLRYKMILKSIFVNGILNLSAASVMLVSDCQDITFLPRSENEIKIMISPLVVGKINVVIEFLSEEKKFSNITRRIEVTGEEFKLKLEQPNNSEIHFGFLTEQDIKSVPLIIKNENSSRIPLKFSILEDNQAETFVAKAILESYFECDVCINTHEMLFDFPTAVNLHGKLLVQLDTYEETILNRNGLFYTIPLSAIIGKINLTVNDDLPFTLKCNSLTSYSSGHLKLKNTGVIPLDLTVQTNETKVYEFIIEPTNFVLLPNHQKYLKINFKPCIQNKIREVNLRFLDNNTKKIFYSKIAGIIESDSVLLSSSSSPLKTSRENCVTPKSGSSGSSNGADGPMELESTHECVSWSSMPLYSKNIQTITLRNRNSQKEKLILTIADVSNSFKFIENESYDKELKLTLDWNESRKISIVFTPFVADQVLPAKIVITRRNTLETSTSDMQKRVIPLYGMGGQIKLSFSGVFRDNENRLWITPDSDTYEAKFTIENTGDSIAFVKLVSEDSDDEIIPEDVNLLPAESVEINFVLHLTKDRLDVLFKENSLKEVLLANKLVVYSGNESTRLRLKKLWSNCKDTDNIQRIREKIEKIVNMNGYNRVQVDCMKDSKSVLNKLWLEGVTEHTIGVLIPRSYLESANLDSTVVFKNLGDSSMTFEF